MPKWAMRRMCSVRYKIMQLLNRNATQIHRVHVLEFVCVCVWYIRMFARYKIAFIFAHIRIIYFYASTISCRRTWRCVYAKHSAIADVIVITITTTAPIMCSNAILHILIYSECEWLHAPRNGWTVRGKCCPFCVVRVRDSDEEPAVDMSATSDDENNYYISQKLN